jgi:ribosomal protein S27E
MKCSNCGHWNSVPVNKAFFEPEPKVRWMIPMYQPVQITKCEKCGKIIAEPKVLIRIIQGKVEYWREK